MKRDLKRSIESNMSFVEKLQGMKFLETAIQLQSDFAKTQFKNLISEMVKTGEMHRQGNLPAGRSRN